MGGGSASASASASVGSGSAYTSYSSGSKQRPPPWAEAGAPQELVTSASQRILRRLGIGPEFAPFAAPGGAAPKAETAAAAPAAPAAPTATPAVLTSGASVVSAASAASASAASIWPVPGQGGTCCAVHYKVRYQRRHLKYLQALTPPLGSNDVAHL